MAEPQPRKPTSVSQRRRRGKLHRALRELQYILVELEPAYVDYVRIHRLVHDCDPEPGDVPSDAPITDAED